MITVFFGQLGAGNIFYKMMIIPLTIIKAYYFCVLSTTFLRDEMEKLKFKSLWSFALVIIYLFIYFIFVLLTIEIKSTGFSFDMQNRLVSKKHIFYTWSIYL